MQRWILRVVSGMMVLALTAVAADTTVPRRLYGGLTLTLLNNAGTDFSVEVELRDINYLSRAPSEVLFKVYAPDGRALVREVIPDDGIQAPMYNSPVAGWDHEAWYYETVRSRGLQPMVRWSAFSDPARLAAMPARTFRYAIKGGGKGRYQVLLVGGKDIYATVRTNPNLPTGYSGSVDWLHGYGALYQKSFLYLPKPTDQVQMMFFQVDRPAQRKMRLYCADKTVLTTRDLPGITQKKLVLSNGRYEMLDGNGKKQRITVADGDFLILSRDAQGAFVYVDPKKGALQLVTFDATAGYGRRKHAVKQMIREVPPGGTLVWATGDRGLARASVNLAESEWNRELILTCEVSGGPGDFLLCGRATIKQEKRPWRGLFSVPLIFCDTQQMAQAMQGGAIYHDNRVFWHPFQVRYHDFIKTLRPEDCVIPKGLARQKEKFISEGSHNSPRRDQADHIMYDYPVHRNRNALNAALVEMEVGLDLIGPGDYIAIGPVRNLAYENNLKYQPFEKVKP